MLKGDHLPPKTGFAAKGLKPVITRKQAEARARERSLNQFLLTQLEEALRLLGQKEEVIRRYEAGERRYTCQGCHTTVWGVWSGPPEGWQLFQDLDGLEAHLCPSCGRPRRKRQAASPLHAVERD